MIGLQSLSNGVQAASGMHGYSILPYPYSLWGLNICHSFCSFNICVADLCLLCMNYLFPCTMMRRICLGFFISTKQHWKIQVNLLSIMFYLFSTCVVKLKILVLFTNAVIRINPIVTEVRRLHPQLLQHWRQFLLVTTNKDTIVPIMLF